MPISRRSFVATAGGVLRHVEITYLFSSFADGATVQGSPAISHGMVFAGALDGSVVALDAATGTKLWRRHVGGQVIASPAVVGNVVFAAGTGGDLKAFRRTDGARSL